MLTYQNAALSVICASGLFIGAYIAKNAVEELKDGLKYIKLGMMGLFYITLLLTFYNFFKNIFITALTPLLIILLIYFLPKKLFKYSKDYLFIIILSFCLAVNYETSLNYILISIIFLNLTLIGSLQYFHKHLLKDKKSFYATFIIKFLTFIILTIIAGFIFSLF